MGFISSMNTAATGLTAQRLRMDVIANNLANAETLRTTDGGPFRRSEIIFRPITGNEQPTWRSHFVARNLQNGIGQGVRVSEIVEDRTTQPRLVYDPSHPDAIKSGPRAGYVEYPNVHVVEEMVNMTSAARAYEANTVVITTAQQMFQAALGIGQ